MPAPPLSSDPNSDSCKRKGFAMITKTQWSFGLCLLLTITSAVSSGQPGEKSPSKSPPELSGLDEKILGDKQAAESAAAILEAAYRGKAQPENVRMLLCILRGSRMGPNDGWFGPSQTRFT